MRSFRELLRAEFFIFVRDKASLSFTFLFPLVFILIFGFLMGGMGEVENARLGLFVPAEVESEVLEEIVSETGSMGVTHYDDRSSLQVALGKRAIDFGLIWNGTKLLFFYDSSRVQGNYAFEEVARGIAAKFNLRHQGLNPLLAVEKVHVGTEAATNWFNLVVPGILAFSILSAGLFAVSGHITAMKERKLLDRMIVTPMRPISFLAALICIRLAVVYISTLITLFTAILVFDLTFTVDWLRYTVFVAASTVGMMGFGTLIALLVRRPSSASNLANILSLTMMFFAGIYFPVEIMPSYLRAVSKALPLTYMAEAMRFTTGVIDMMETRFWGITIALLTLAVILLPLLARYVVRPEQR